MGAVGWAQGEGPRSPHPPMWSVGSGRARGASRDPHPPISGLRQERDRLACILHFLLQRGSFSPAWPPLGAPGQMGGGSRVPVALWLSGDYRSPQTPPAEPLAGDGWDLESEVSGKPEGHLGASGFPPPSRPPSTSRWILPCECGPDPQLFPKPCEGITYSAPPHYSSGGGVVGVSLRSLEISATPGGLGIGSQGLGT